MELDRDTLYEQVWEIPISRLCESYGLSDQGLKKACVKLQIPLPQRGHWAKVAAGHSIARPPLPPLQARGGNSPPELRRSRQPAVLVQRSAEGAASQITVSPPLTEQFHLAIRKAVSDYVQAETDALQLKAKFDWEQEHPGRTYKGIAPQFGSWSYFSDAGQLLRATHRKSFLRASLTTYRRALRLLQSLIVRLETAGFVVELSEGRERLKAMRDSATVLIKVTEKLNAGQRTKLNSWSKKPEVVKFLVPTGRLVIGIEQEGLGDTQISDRSDALLEDQLERVMAAVEHRHHGSLETIARWKRERQESADRERSRQEDLRLREVAQRVLEAEKAKRLALRQEADDWQFAENIRAYVLHLEHRQKNGGVEVDGYVEWRAWAMEVARELDPSDGRVGSGDT